MRTLLVGPNGRGSCLGALSEGYHLELAAHFPAPANAVSYVQVEPDAPGALVVDVSLLHDPRMDNALVQLLDAAALRWPGCRAAVVLGDAQQYLLDQLQHAHTRVFSTDGGQNDAAALAGGVAAYLDLPRRQGARAKTILVLSSKGGVGKTTLVANLATALAVRHDLRLAAVDGDLTRGDLALLLGADCPTTLKDLIADRSPGGIQGAIDHHLAHLHGGRLALLAAPGNSLGSEQPWTSLTTRHAQAVLAALGHRYDVVLVDTPPDVQRSSPFPAAVVGDANLPFLALVIVQPQPMERQGARQVLEFLAAYASPGRQVRGVLVDRNRAAGNAGQLERLFKIPVVGSIPYDPAAATARQATDLVYDFSARRLRGAAKAYAELARCIAEGDLP